ncbi:MAG: hypothetical protein L0L09_08790 [Staphylococcus equorum]|uniref:hypothetical protein n=1 Tax=Staphylococcus TaxID=1279 RepID=UPI00159EFF92|nr:hypothetical protein [Staphylococcus equorum]MDG0821587.1 hypothetical protein [Staphylococcus equorum]MDG0837568.1 hypothetical protein [Staphylococcus equorum]MDK9872130.1 hypothetical protein [Staphylococcus equorum]MDK9876762.1 hypothetical protein [Staphylococcus equorum]MDN5809108.1 hypothetical protein [Staphylococcus equorum]
MYKKYKNVIEKSKSLYEELIQTEILPKLKLEMNEEMSNQDLKADSDLMRLLTTG